MCPSEGAMGREVAGPAANPPAPARLWTVAEANARLDGLRELLDQLKEWAVRLGEVHSELRRLTEFWGKEIDASDHADRPLKERLEAEWKNLSRRLDEAVESLRGEGIELKEIDTGLVDFYAIQDGVLVLLCWRRDEPRVAFYHTLEGGFRGRRPIPEPDRAVAARPDPTL
jgi:hypothetical protein